MHNCHIRPRKPMRVAFPNFTLPIICHIHIKWGALKIATLLQRSYRSQTNTLPAWLRVVAVKTTKFKSKLWSRLLNRSRGRLYYTGCSNYSCGNHKLYLLFWWVALCSKIINGVANHIISNLRTSMSYRRGFCYTKHLETHDVIICKQLNNIMTSLVWNLHCYI